MLGSLSYRFLILNKYRFAFKYSQSFNLLLKTSFYSLKVILDLFWQIAKNRVVTAPLSLVGKQLRWSPWKVSEGGYKFSFEIMIMLHVIGKLCFDGLALTKWQVQNLQSLNKNRITMKDWEASPRPFESCWPGVYQAVNTFLRGE